MPTAKEKENLLRSRARTTRTAEEIEEDKISDDFNTALKQLAALGLRPKRDPNWVAEEQDKLEEMDTDGGLMTFGKSVARGTVGIPAGTLEAIGIGTTWLKDQVGLSDDVEDNTFYNWGRALKKKGVLGLGAEGYIPNKFRGGAAGFMAVDAPQGVGSALGFVGEAAATGGIASVGKKALQKGAGKFLVKDAAVDNAVREAVSESEHLAINLALKSGADVTEKQLKQEVKRVTAKDISDVVRKRLQEEADRGFKATVGTYSIAGIGGAVQGAEGYHDAYNTLLLKAREEGRDALTKDETDQLFMAFVANIPAGFAEVFGVEAPLLRSIFLGKKLSRADVAKYGGADKVAQQAGAISKTRRLWDNLDHSSGGLFSRGMSRFAPILGGITREALQEGSQSAWMNMVAADVARYDKNRSLWDGVGKDSGVGGVVGGLFSMVSLVMGRKANKIRDIERAKEQAQRAEEAGNYEASDEFRKQVRELEENFNATESVDQDEVSNELDQMDAGVQEEIDKATAPVAEEEAGLGLKGKGAFSTYGVQLRPLESWSDKDKAKFLRLNPTYSQELEAGIVADPVYIGQTKLTPEERAGEHFRPDSKFGAYLAKEYGTGNIAPGIGMEQEYRTKEEATEAERALVGQSSAYIAEESLMKPAKPVKKESKQAKKNRLNREKKLREATATARVEQAKTGKAHKFTVQGQGSFVVTQAGEIEQFKKSTDANTRASELNYVADQTVIERAKLGDKPYRIRKLKNSLEGDKYLVVTKDKAIRTAVKPTAKEARELLELEKPKKGEGKTNASVQERIDAGVKPRTVFYGNPYAASTTVPDALTEAKSGGTEFYAQGVGNYTTESEGVAGFYARGEKAPNAKDKKEGYVHEYEDFTSEERTLKEGEKLGEQGPFFVELLNKAKELFGPAKAERFQKQIDDYGVTGQHFYGTLQGHFIGEQTGVPLSEKAFGDRTVEEKKAASIAASLWLREQGVEAISYLGGGDATTKRGAGKHTNRVVLRNDLVRVKRSRMVEDAWEKEDKSKLTDDQIIEANVLSSTGFTPGANSSIQGLQRKYGKDKVTQEAITKWAETTSADLKIGTSGKMGAPAIAAYEKEALSDLEPVAPAETAPAEPVTPAPSVAPSETGVNKALMEKLLAAKKARQDKTSAEEEHGAATYDAATLDALTEFGRNVVKEAPDFGSWAVEMMRVTGNDPSDVPYLRPAYNRLHDTVDLELTPQDEVRGAVGDAVIKMIETQLAKLPSKKKASTVSKPVSKKEADEAFFAKQNAIKLGVNPSNITNQSQLMARLGVPKGLIFFNEDGSSILTAGAGEAANLIEMLPEDRQKAEEAEAKLERFHILSRAHESGRRRLQSATERLQTVKRKKEAEPEYSLYTKGKKYPKKISLSDRIELLKAKQKEMAAALNKEFPGYLTSEKSAGQVIKSLQVKASASVSPHQIEEMEQHEHTYKTLAGARKGARAIQKKNPHKAVGMLKRPDGTYAVYSEYHGPIVVKPVPVEGGSDLIAALSELTSAAPPILDDSLNVTQGNVIEGLTIDFSGENLAANEGKGDVDGYVTKLAERLGVQLPAEVTEKIMMEDGTGIPRGLAGEVARQVAVATTGTSQFRGLSIKNIKFGKSKARKMDGNRIVVRGAPMFTLPHDGHDTIYVDPTALVDSFRLGHTIEEFVGHELSHVITIRAIRSAVIHQINKEGKNMSDPLISKRVTDLMRNIWTGHLRKAVQQAHDVSHIEDHSSEAYRDGVALLEAMSEVDQAYNAVPSSNRIRLGYKTENGVTRPVAIGGSTATGANKGGEWTRALIDRATKDAEGTSSLPYSIGDVASKNSAGKVFSWMSLLTAADLGMSRKEEMPNAIQTMISAARTIGHGSNVFVQRAIQLKDAGVIDMVFDAAQKYMADRMRTHYQGAAPVDAQGNPLLFTGVEPSFFSAHMPYFEESVIKEAAIHHQMLSEVNNIIYTPTKLVNVALARREHRGARSNDNYTWSVTSFNDEWTKEEGQSWVLKVSDEVQLKDIAEANNTTEKVIHLNNPGLADKIENLGLRSGERILMHGQPEGVLGGFSVDALFKHAWQNARNNNAPIKLRRDRKADALWVKAHKKLEELRKTNAPVEQIKEAEDALIAAKIKSDLAADKIAMSSRSSNNDLQGRTDRIVLLSQSQMLGELPSTADMIAASMDGANEGVLPYDPPPSAVEPSQRAQDIKAWKQLSEEKTKLMQMLQENGSMGLIEDSGLDISTRDLINLLDLLIQPHEVEGMLASRVIKRRGAEDKAGLAFLTKEVQRLHNIAAGRLSDLKELRDDIQDRIVSSEDSVEIIGLKKDLADVQAKIRKERETHFDGGHEPSVHAAVLQPSLIMGEATAEGRYEGKIKFEQDEKGKYTGKEAKKMLGLIAQILIESDLVLSLTDQTGKYLVPSREGARAKLKAGEVAETDWYSELARELDPAVSKTWNTKEEWVMVGTSETGLPIYEKQHLPPWEASHTRVIREEIRDKDGVVVPALMHSTKEQWDKYIADGGTRPWQHHVMGYTESADYLPSSHQMRIIQAALGEWARSSREEFGAATMPEMEQTFDYVNNFWDVMEGIRDEYRTGDTKVKSRSKVGKGRKVTHFTNEESTEVMNATAAYILTGNPKGKFNNETEIDPSAPHSRFEEIIQGVKGNPKGFAPNDYLNLMGGIRLAARDLDSYWENRQDELNADQQMRLDQLVAKAEDAQVEEAGLVGGALANQRARNQLLGVVGDMTDWKKKIKELQEKVLGKLVNNDFLDKIKRLITQASHRANTLAVTPEIVEAISKVAPGDPRVALGEAIETLEWNKNANKGKGAPQYQVQKPELRKAIKEKLGEHLTDGDIDSITAALIKNWQKARLEAFRDMLGKAGLHDGASLTLSNLVNSAERILKARDVGKLGKQTVVKAGDKSVVVGITHLWDALSPEANLPYGQDKTSKMLSEIQDRIRSGDIEGVEAAHLRYKVLKEVMSRKDMRWLSAEIAKDLWYSGALSGLRTFVDIGVGGSINGFMTSVAAATDLLATRRGVNPTEDAGNIMLSYIKTWAYDGLPTFFEILKTGDMSNLPDANERLTRQMTEDFYGGESLDAMERKLKAEGKPWWHPKRLGTLGRFSRRFVLGLDYVGAQAGRRAMMVYGASTRLWEAKKAGDGKDLTALKDQYAQTQKLADKDIKNRAKVKAEAALRKQFAKDEDIKVTKAMILAKAREIMESHVSEDLIESSNELGRVFALNSDPIGIGAQLHSMAQASGVLKYGAGLAFSRAAINMMAVASNYVPGLGYINAFRSSQMAHKIFDKFGWNDSKWGNLLNLRHGDNPISEERAKVIQLQAVTGTIIMALLWQMLDDDDWELHGSMENMSHAQRSQLLSQGVKPYSIRYKGSPYVSFKATPIAMLLGGFGNIREGMVYGNDDPSTAFEKFMIMQFNGFSFAMDVGPAAYSMRLLQMAQRSDEHSRAQFLGAFAQGLVGPVISPNLFREIDGMLDDRYYKPLKDQHLAAFWSQLVFIPGTGFPRRTGMKPMLNAFGEEVDVKRHPLSRWIGLPKGDPVWQVVAAKSRQGVFLPGVSRGAKLVTSSGEYRDMTPNEEYEYQRRTGNGIKFELEQNLEYFRSLGPQESKDWLDSKANSIRKRLRSEMGRAAK